MKKIALVTEFFYPTTGGTQTAVAHIAHSLSERGYAVTVFAPLPTINQPDQPSSHYTTVWLPAHITLLPTYIQIQARLIGLLADYDLIHLFHPAFGLGALLARWLFPPSPLIVTLMGYDTYGFHDLRYSKRWVTQWVCQAADIVTSPSSDLAQLAQAHGVTRPIEIIPHGIPSLTVDRILAQNLRHNLGIPTEAIVCLAVQRHYPIKEPQVFLESWERLTHPDCYLILVGGGELEETLREQAQHQSNVIIAGEIPHSEVPNYLAVADIFLHHSRYESFGIGVLEAMSVGLPVIASCVGALPEIITEGYNGYLIPPSQPDQLAAAISRLVDSPAKRQAMGENAKQTAQTYLWSNIIQKYENLYRHFS